MKFTKSSLSIFLLFSLLLFSCNENLIELNENPNGVDPNTAHPNLLISTVMTSLASSTVNRGYAGTTGVGIQYTQRDAWSSNRYYWGTEGVWGAYYNILRTNKLAHDRAVEMGLEFHEGVTLVLRAMLFGTLADFYGDIPYTAALSGDEPEGEKPAYDKQEDVYKGVIADLEKASELLSGTDYKDVSASQDVFYHGDVAKWQKLANSLALRYYMRLSEKLPSFAADGVANTLKKPLISSIDDECVLPFIGGTENQSWPNSGQFGTPSDFYRIKGCATLVDKLRDLDDPRMGVWFDDVDIRTKVVPADEMPGGGDTLMVIDEENSIRYINADSIGAVGTGGENFAIYSPETYFQDALDNKVLIDTNLYVGLPVAVSDVDPTSYNLNTHAIRGDKNPYVSRMNPIFNEKSGDQLKARLFSYAEVCFLKSEAALKGWGSDAEGNYYAGIQASFDTWGIGGQAADYMANPDVAYDGTLDMIIEQKWIANMFNGDEAYLDWRRTGLPNLNPGPYAREEVMPVRFVYPSEERTINEENNKTGLASLEDTDYTEYDKRENHDSPYAKPWIIQDVNNKPW